MFNIIKNVTKFYDSFFSWEKLTEIYTFKYFRYLVAWFGITPVAVFVLKNSNYIPFLKNGTLQLPFSWKILWFSSFLFVIGWTVFIFSVPKFILKYKNLQNFERMSYPTNYLKQEWDNYMERLHSFREIIENKKITKNIERNEISIELKCAKMNLNLQNYMEMHKKIKNGYSEYSKYNETKVLTFFKFSKYICFDYNLEDLYAYKINNAGDEFCNNVGDGCHFEFHVYSIRHLKDENARKENFLILFSIHEGQRTVQKFIISIITTLSLIFFLIVLGQNIVNTLIYII